MWRLAFALVFIFLISAVKVEGEGDSLELNGKASYYHDDFNGLKTSNGESYNASDFTAAHRTFPFNTLLLVINKKNDKSVIVRVNDRGPFKKSRVIDLSRSAAVKVGMVPFGVVPVRIEVLNFFDRFSISDSLFGQGDIINCFSQKVSLEKETVFIWQTKDWKHAFYMASSLSLEYKNEHICVRISGPPHKRIFQVLLTSIDDKKVAAKWVSNLKKSGFNGASLFSKF